MSATPDVAAPRGRSRRIPIALTVLATTSLLLLLAMSRQGDRVQVIDVGAKVREVAAGRGPDANTALFFHRDPRVSIHLHFMGRRHLCPLHIHPGGSEATVIVSGAADVSHRFGSAGAIATSTRRYLAGAVVASPPSCGHEWENASASEPLGNLVLSSPPFETNVYVRAEDPRLLQGAAPSSYEVDETELAELERSGEAFRRRPLDMLGGKLSVALVRTEMPVEASADGAIALYVLRGTGAVLAPRAADLGPTSLAILPASRAGTLRAGSGGVLVALVLRP